jgi:anti-sigma B factor antagonist
MMSQTTYPRVLVETVQGITVATFSEEMIIAEDVIHDVDEQLDGLVDATRPANILLNFREVRCMSSTMLAVLLKLARKVGAAGGRLKLCGLSENLQEIFKITRFDRLFEIHDEEWLALDSF